MSNQFGPKPTASTQGPGSETHLSVLDHEKYSLIGGLVSAVICGSDQRIGFLPMFEQGAGLAAL
jgi:hypothetical protein